MSESPSPECPFCQVEIERVIEHNASAIALADAFPVSPGHTLIIPRRHISDFFELSTGEAAAIFDLLRRVEQRLRSEHGPAGFNIGVNVGIAAGQTVMHAHVHLIPRYAGDVPDPTGGVRGVIPGKRRYDI